jgi:hypothetical protein
LLSDLTQRQRRKRLEGWNKKMLEMLKGKGKKCGKKEEN